MHLEAVHSLLLYNSISTTRSVSMQHIADTSMLPYSFLPSFREGITFSHNLYRAIPIKLVNVVTGSLHVKLWSSNRTCQTFCHLHRPCDPPGPFLILSLPALSYGLATRLGYTVSAWFMVVMTSSPPITGNRGVIYGEFPYIALFTPTYGGCGRFICMYKLSNHLATDNNASSC